MPEYRIILKHKATGDVSTGYATTPKNTQELVEHIRVAHRHHDLLKAERVDKPEPPFIAAEPDPNPAPVSHIEPEPLPVAPVAPAGEAKPQQ